LRLLFELERGNDPIFTIRDAKRVLNSSDASVWNVLKRLRAKRRIIQLEKGVYLFAPMRSGERGLWTENAFRVVPYLVHSGKYYVGFAAAMNHWGMTEQLPVVFHVAMARQKRALEAVQSRFVFVKKKRLGDYVSVPFGGTPVNISSIEQTILDGLAFPEHCLGIAGVARAIHFSRDRIDWEKLARLAREDKSVIQRRLGFLLEMMGLGKRAKLLRRQPFTGFSWLDPAAQKQRFTYAKEWGLKINVDRSALLEFRRGY